MSDRWQLLEIDVMEHPPALLTPDDHCYYAREYMAHRGFGYSNDNNLIYNFKKPPTERRSNPAAWTYKQQAAATFAEELSLLFLKGAIIMFAPTSNTEGADNYDPRFDMVGNKLKICRPDISIIHPIRRIRSRAASHAGGRREVSDIIHGLEWTGTPLDGIAHVALVDDIIVKGTTFRAVSEMFRKHAPWVTVHGAFWAIARS